MLIDDVTINIRAGSGGNGAVAFNKTKMAKGPAGGDGGQGGSVYAIGVSDLSALRQFQYKKDIKAQNGQAGMGYFKNGKDGIDTILKIPVGTIIHNMDTRQDFEMLSIGQKLLLAKGGRLGRGNCQFKSSTNTTPLQAEPGRPGQEFKIRMELKLIADIGIIGLPNAGKSSLINEITKARAKVANYPFTTLEPNLGVFEHKILADIPGLISGASSGKGLGIKFLRHIERTKILFHLVSSQSNALVKDYKIVRNELKKYNPALLEKKEYLFLSKSDAIAAKDLKLKLAKLKKINPRALTISIYDFDSMESVKKILYEISEAK